VTEKINKVVLAYSGGLDTSVILKWLIETYDCEVVTFSADIGQGDEVEQTEKNAEQTGAIKVYVDDLTETFVKDYVFPAFRANAIYEGQYLLGTSIARPLIAKRQMEIAARRRRCGQPRRHRQRQRPGPLRAGLSGHQSPHQDHRPLARVGPEFAHGVDGFCRAHGIAVPTTHAKPYSTDRNLLHISYEGGVLEDPGNAPPEDMFTLTVSPKDAPDDGAR
jgi:argininosuccinate synthase